MRVIIQRVSEASVSIGGSEHSRIGRGLMILLGVEENDGQDDATWLAQKIVRMRIFSDSDGKMNLDVEQAGGDILVVSQFTLHALTRKGNRPSFIRAARPEKAIPLYEFFVQSLSAGLQKTIRTGVFGADMAVALINDGPVTIYMDSKDQE